MRKKMYALPIFALGLAAQLQSQTLMIATDFTLPPYNQNLRLQVAPLKSLPLAFFAKCDYKANYHQRVLPRLEITMPTKTFEVGLKYYCNRSCFFYTDLSYFIPFGTPQ
jgi:hypothetical protein